MRLFYTNVASSLSNIIVNVSIEKLLLSTLFLLSDHCLSVLYMISISLFLYLPLSLFFVYLLFATKLLWWIKFCIQAAVLYVFLSGVLCTDRTVGRSRRCCRHSHCLRRTPSRWECSDDTPQHRTWTVHSHTPPSLDQHIDTSNTAYDNQSIARQEFLIKVA